MSDQFPSDEQPTRRHIDDATRRAPAERPPQTVVSDRTLQRRMPPPEPEPEPETSALYVPWWAFALVILVVAGLTCGLWGVVLMNRGDIATNSGPTPTPIFVVITATPTLGPAPGGTIPANPSPLPPPGETPTAETTPTVEPTGEITVGSTIMVSGTGGDGLAVRQGPGREYAFIFVANDGETFLVQDGPREADGYVWWYIVDPNNPDRFGWAVADYMQVVQ